MLIPFYIYYPVPERRQEFRKMSSYTWTSPPGIGVLPLAHFIQSGGMSGFNHPCFSQQPWGLRNFSSLDGGAGGDRTPCLPDIIGTFSRINCQFSGFFPYTRDSSRTWFVVLVALPCSVFQRVQYRWFSKDDFSCRNRLSRIMLGQPYCYIFCRANVISVVKFTP